SHSC
ncbi:hypothetical protein AB1N83_004659, partial [Pleurotus pulmonarius]